MKENFAKIQLRFDSIQAQLIEKNNQVQKLTVKCSKFAEAAKNFKTKAEQYAQKYNKLL